MPEEDTNARQRSRAAPSVRSVVRMICSLLAAIERIVRVTGTSLPRTDATLANLVCVWVRRRYTY
jgi:hypothetical protein